MSKTALVGGIGLAPQSAKGTPATIFGAANNWLPATAINLNAQQQTQMLPPEIAGSYLPRLAYKSSVAVSGEASVLMRPDSVGHLLSMLCGSHTTTAVPAQTGAYSHVFNPFTAGGSGDLPWYTIHKNVSGLWHEEYDDVKLGSLRMNLQKQGVAMASAGFFGLTPTEVADWPGGTAPAAFDFGPVFQTCRATVSLVNESGGVAISPNSALVDSVSLDFTSRLSEDEYVVGSYTPVDITLLQREVSIGYDLVIRDPALRRAVYQNGASTNWASTVYRGHLSITLDSGQVIGTSTQNYQLTIDIPGMDFMVMPISMNGASLIRANLSARVSLGPSGTDQFTFTLINGVASY